MKLYIVVENFSKNLEPMSGNNGSIFFDRKKALDRLGHYKRNQNVQIIEVELNE